MPSIVTHAPCSIARCSRVRLSRLSTLLLDRGADIHARRGRRARFLFRSRAIDMAIWGPDGCVAILGLRAFCCRVARPTILPSLRPWRYRVVRQMLDAHLSASARRVRAARRPLSAAIEMGPLPDCAFAARTGREPELGRAVGAERPRAARGSPRWPIVAGGVAPRSRRRPEQRHRFFGQRVLCGRYSRD